MVGNSNQSQGGYDPGTTDWLNKASPEQLVTQGVAVVDKIASMDQSTQDQFLRQLHNNPTAARLFERIGSFTA